MGDTEPACEGWLLSRTVSSQQLPLPASSLSLFTTLQSAYQALSFLTFLYLLRSRRILFLDGKKISYTYRHCEKRVCDLPKDGQIEQITAVRRVSLANMSVACIKSVPVRPR